MNYLDIILFIPILWGLYKGLVKGIIKELASLAAFIFGTHGALLFSQQIQPILKANTSIDESFLPIIAFTTTFIVIVLLVRLLALMLNKIVKIVALGMISRLSGGVFGALKVSIIMSALLLVVNTVDYHIGLIPNKQKKNSLLYQPISDIVPIIILPNVKDGNRLLKEAERALKEAEESIPL